MQIPKEQQLIGSAQELLKQFISMQQKCAQIQNYEDPGMTNQQIIQKFLFFQKCIQNLSIFSQNEKLTDIQTQHLKFLCLPYHIGYLFGKISNPRRESILQSKNYLNAFLNLCQIFNCQDEEIFPKNAMKTWKNLTSVQAYKPSRDELVANMKQKKLIEVRYQNISKIKDESQQRQSIKDFISLQIYESISFLKSIAEQTQILKYKQSLSKDQKVKQAHQAQLNKPIPKMKVWNIKAQQEINRQMLSSLPRDVMTKKQDVIAQVWQQNANRPTMTLQQVGDLQYDNMVARTQRQKKYAEENQVDMDSDKEENDHREKTKARKWDDWKDQNQKGAGNRNKSTR